MPFREIDEVMATSFLSNPFTCRQQFTETVKGLAKAFALFMQTILQD